MSMPFMINNVAYDTKTGQKQYVLAFTCPFWTKPDFWGNSSKHNRFSLKGIVNEKGDRIHKTKQ